MIEISKSTTIIYLIVDVPEPSKILKLSPFGVDETLAYNSWLDVYCTYFSIHNKNPYTQQRIQRLKRCIKYASCT